MNKRMVSLVLVFILALSGCGSEPLSSKDLSLIEDDFSFTYNNVVINDTIPIEDITDKLGFGSRYKDNNDGLISQNNGVSRRGIYYPDDNPKLFLVFIDYNDKYLVFADLIDVPTKRGIQVGDSVNRMNEKYGVGSINEDHYDYSLGNKRLLFYVDKESNKITRIIIDYNMEKADKEQGI